MIELSEDQKKNLTGRAREDFDNLYVYQEKIKPLAADILKQCQQRSLTISEFRMLIDDLNNKHIDLQKRCSKITAITFCQEPQS